ncbi:hypothetical protein K1719_039415 [Acacia pycnantha]|nr:hypothetical protein K1719_039415 [Acacia pycnantha]
MGPPAIRDTYDLDLTTNKYHAQLDKSNDRELLNHVLTRLCIASTKWVISEEKAYTFKRTCLKPDTKVGYTFIQTHILSTLHILTVFRDKAFLLYCILKGKAIDIPALVYQELYNCIKPTFGNLLIPWVHH